MKKTKQKLICLFLLISMIGSVFTGCGTDKDTTSEETNTLQSEEMAAAEENEATEENTETQDTITPTEEVSETSEFSETEIQVFIAASLSNAMEEIKSLYNEAQPNVTITYNADSSGTLLSQIQEGFECDIFFSASTKQMTTLEEEGFVTEGTKVDLLKNQVVLITPKNSGTQVTGFEDMEKASSMALADGSVPVGKYTRNILVNLKKLPETEDSSVYTTAEVSEALGGLEINECGNVSKVAEAVKEGSNEIGTVYYSDAYSVKDDIDIIAYADTALSGDIIYPVAQISNSEADEIQASAAADFLNFLQTEEAKAIFEKYMFITE